MSDLTDAERKHRTKDMAWLCTGCVGLIGGLVLVHYRCLATIDVIGLFACGGLVGLWAGRNGG